MDRSSATFAELLDLVEATYVVPPEYVGERKVAGLRSWRDQRRILKTLRAHFGCRVVQTLTYSDVRHFRSVRLKVPVNRSRIEGTSKLTQRSIATVNRELAQLRRVLNIAVREGWIARNPFSAGESLISPADEKPRERIITRDEERLLLSKCSSSRRIHLRDMIICALDTGMRFGEIKTLRWSDIDFEKRSITIRAFNTKTMRSRAIALTSRLLTALQARAAAASHDPTSLVFGIADTVKTAFGSVRHEAGLDDLRFHDLRHTAATRLVRGGLPLAEVGRILGHTQPRTTFRYVNADADTAERAASILDKYGNGD